MADNAHKIFNEMNKFRANPGSLQPTVKKFSNGLARLDPKNPLILKYNKFGALLKFLPPNKELKFSEELSNACQKYIENCKSVPKKKVLVGEECKGIVPPNYCLGDSTAFIYHDDFNTPEQSVIRLLCDQEDPDNIGKNLLTKDIVSQVGIAVKEADEDAEDDESCVVFILSEEEMCPGDDILQLDATGEIWKAFQALDLEKKNKLPIKEICELLEESGKSESDPVLFNMLNELNDGKEEVTWKEFYEHFSSRLADDKTEERRKEKFEVFKPNADYEVLDVSVLKKISNYLELGYDEDRIRKMLKMNKYNKYGISFEDYLDYLSRKKEVDEE